MACRDAPLKLPVQPCVGTAALEPTQDAAPDEHAEGHAQLLEYPVYTKPPSWRGLEVPDVLRSGHHGQVAAWRREQALRRTAERRPDLLADL